VLKVINEEMCLTPDGIKALPGGKTAIHWVHLDRTCNAATFEALFMVLCDFGLLEHSFDDEVPEISDIFANIIIKSGYSGKRLPRLFMAYRSEATDPKVINGWNYMLKRIGILKQKGRLATIVESAEEVSI